MKTNWIIFAFACTGVLIGAMRLTEKLAARENPAPAAGSAVSVERGRHLIRISGCNDCHTPGFMEKGEQIPESEWLTGVALGWRGPWGTSYPSNLRRQLAAWKDATAWIAMVRGRKGLPPMPWTSLHAMTDDELRSVHAYIRSLPVTGESTPAPVPPAEEPKSPYLNLAPVMPH